MALIQTLSTRSVHQGDAMSFNVVDIDTDRKLENRPDSEHTDPTTDSDSVHAP
jgi:hypothetical protein